MPDALLRLDKRPADIVVPYEAEIKGMPLSSEYPRAAGTPESGTGMTRSASTRDSRASCLPNSFLISLTFWPPKILLSGRAK